MKRSSTCTYPFIARYYFAAISFKIALLNKHKKGLDVSVILPQLPFSNILRGLGLVKNTTVVFSDCYAITGKLHGIGLQIAIC